MKDFFNFKYILFFSLFVVTFDAYSQTPAKTKPPIKPTFEQTINWILEKLNAYSTDCKYLLDPKHYRFSYDINSNSIMIFYAIDWNSNYIEDQHFKILFPIQYFDKIVYNSYSAGSLTLYTYGKNVSQQCRGCSDNTDLSNIDNIEICFDITRENNMLPRIQKAFADLKSYYPKKQEDY